MTIPPKVSKKFYTLRGLALILGAFAVAIFILRPPGFGIRLLAFVAIFVGLWIVWRSNVSVWRARGLVVGECSPATAAKRVGRLAWILTAVSLIACGVCAFLVHLDALHGGKETWPAYALMVAVLALAVTASYVVFGVFRGIFR